MTNATKWTSYPCTSHNQREETLQPLHPLPIVACCHGRACTPMMPWHCMDDHGTTTFMDDDAWMTHVLHTGGMLSTVVKLIAAGCIIVVHGQYISGRRLPLF